MTQILSMKVAADQNCFSTGTLSKKNSCSFFTIIMNHLCAGMRRRKRSLHCPAKCFSSNCFSMRRVALLAFLLLFIVIPRATLCSDNNTRLYARDYALDYERMNERLLFDIEGHSGTPPILEFVLKDMDNIVHNVSLDFDSDGEIDLRIENIENDVVFRGVPYRKKGTYKASAFIETIYGTFMREFIVSFTDFVWGKDNFRFANDGEFEDSVDPVSKSVVQWASDRFGHLTQDQQALLVYLMYRIFKGSIGRCYAFSGGEAKYLENPDQLPSYTLSTYGIDEADREFTRQMDYVQNDIVFSNFLSGRINLEEDQDSESLNAELLTIQESIHEGKPIILGYLSRRMHHSLVVYGYFFNAFRNKTTLLVANNWEREQNSNSFSEDAENIVVQINGNRHTIVWYDLTKRTHRYPEKIFGIEMDEEYNLEYQDFFHLLQRLENEIKEKDNIVVIVEEAEEALLINDEGKKKGYSKPKYISEFNVSFKKIDYNYLFEIPRKGVYRLVLNRMRYNEKRQEYKELNLFFIIPEENGIHAEIFKSVLPNEDSGKIVEIGPQGIEPLN